MSDLHKDANSDSKKRFADHPELFEEVAKDASFAVGESGGFVQYHVPLEFFEDQTGRSCGIVSSIGLDKIFNSLQTTDRSRVITVVNIAEQILTRNAHTVVKIGASRCGVLLTYGVRDFSTTEPAHAESLILISSPEAIDEFGSAQISEDAFVRDSEAYILSRFELKRIELKMQ